MPPPAFLLREPRPRRAARNLSPGNSYLTNFIQRTWRRLMGNNTTAAAHSPTLIVLEGNNDIQFLRRLSRILHVADRAVPDLGQWEQQGRIVFMPLGGGDALWPWTLRLANLNCRAFYLYDREVSPFTEQRQQTVNILNQRPNCRAFLTTKRSLENYLHPRAIHEATGIQIEFGDDDAVATLVAMQRFAASHPQGDWLQLAPRSRQKMRQRVKAVLNTLAVEQMTSQRLLECDPAGEVRMWFSTIRELTAG